jgi:hypothetical protein
LPSKGQRVGINAIWNEMTTTIGIGTKEFSSSRTDFGKRKSTDVGINEIGRVMIPRMRALPGKSGV